MGTLTDEARRMDKERQETHRLAMLPAAENPELYSKVVHRPALTEGNMVGKKLEVSYNIDPNEEGVVEGGGAWVEPYLHVHAGLVVEFYEHAKAVAGFATASKKPLALVEWDIEFRCEGLWPPGTDRSDHSMKVRLGLRARADRRPLESRSMRSRLSERSSTAR